MTATGARRVRDTLAAIAERRALAASLRTAAGHPGMPRWPDAVAHLLDEAERIERAASADLAAVMAEAGAHAV